MVKEILQRIFVILIALISISCEENKQEESLNKYLNIRKQSLLSNQQDIGDRKEKIIENLTNTIKFDQLMGFVERKAYKSNLKSRKIGIDLFEFKETIWNNSQNKTVKIDLKYLVNFDTVRFGLIERLRINNQILSENFIYSVDNHFIDNFINKHNELFSTQKTNKDLINYLTKSQEIRIACGYAGKHYGKRETKMYCDIIDEKFIFIGALLQSISPENQALGVVGYNKLKSLSFENHKNYEKLVKKILSINPEINVCLTCVDKTIKLSNYLNSLDWERIPTDGLKCTNSI